MTVKELIAKLEKFDGDAKVVYEYNGPDAWEDIEVTNVDDHYGDVMIYNYESGFGE